ncbi:MAG: redoxin domain-containing protein [Candidatus Cyclobacteriaceae bacterium M2_1C_046]
MREDIKPGVKFPDYELPDHLNAKRKISHLQGDDPMILVLSRGYFCPKDRQQMHQLVQFSAQCAVGYTKLVTISTDSLMTVNEYRMGVGANWPFLYDEERIIQKDLDIQEYTDTKHDPMIPYTFVLEPGLVIYKIYQGYWYWGRPSKAELHQDLRNVTQKVRPDYKIDTPEMREKWEEKEKENFWPYGKDWDKALARMNGAVDRY